LRKRIVGATTNGNDRSITPTAGDLTMSAVPAVDREHLCATLLHRRSSASSVVAGTRGIDVDELDRKIQASKCSFGEAVTVEGQQDLLGTPFGDADEQTPKISDSTDIAGRRCMGHELTDIFPRAWICDDTNRCGHQHFVRSLGITMSGATVPITGSSTRTSAELNSPPSPSAALDIYQIRGTACAPVVVPGPDAEAVGYLKAPL
jgi:hypothetical protein